MTKLLLTFERRARYVMVVAACLLALLAVAFEAGWIRHEQSYDRHAWYLINNHDKFVITSEFPDEATCRRAATSEAVCRSGGALIDDAAAQVLHNRPG